MALSAVVANPWPATSRRSQAKAAASSTRGASFGPWAKAPRSRGRGGLLSRASLLLWGLFGVVSDSCPLRFLCTADFGSPPFRALVKVRVLGCWVTTLGDFRGLLCSSHARRSHANPRESVRLSAGKDFTSI